MIRQVIREAQDNGPTFRFEIPTDAGPVKGEARRYWVTIELPDGISEELRGRLEEFVKGLRMGQPELEFGA